ncbi:MAG: mevalonate kinase [Candidatus Caldarchaeum sp.]|nr:mevalonate kinase [Candidatus Caldarchaeum sp.]MDW8359392.1 mevalonate kinase [Candidatus Caldarchaeum sp.]
MKPRASASAPGKVILFGEHFVVSGYPAVVTAINMRARVELQREEEAIIFTSRRLMGRWSITGEQVYPEPHKKSSFTPLHKMLVRMMEDEGVRGGLRAEIVSEIPGAAGLGSSAAISTALAQAFSILFELELSREEIVEYAMVAEKEFHGKPSGIDPHAAAYGGTLLYKGPGNFQTLHLDRSPDILVLFTGLKRKTSEMVEHVIKHSSTRPREFSELANLYRGIFNRAVEALKSGDLKLLGELMSLNHYLLKVLGLSNDVVEKYVENLLERGAYGVKLTGAGGGGSIIAAVEGQSFRKLSEWPDQFSKWWLVKTSCPGVRVED